MVLRQPDHEAFSEFASARSASLFRTAYLVIGDYQLAQDLVQESLVKTYLAWPRLHDVTKAEAYTRGDRHHLHLLAAQTVLQRAAGERGSRRWSHRPDNPSARARRALPLGGCCARDRRDCERPG